MKHVKIALCLAAALTLGLTRINAQSSSITVIPTVTEADVINATSLVDPLAEKVKDIPVSSFSLRILNNTTSRETVWVNLHVEAYVTLDVDRVRTRLVSSDTKTPFAVPFPFRLFTSADADMPGSDIDFNNDINTEMKNRLKDMVTDPASGGRVPSGTYELQLTFTVARVGNQTVSEPPIYLAYPQYPQFRVTVTNPTTATLLLPSDNGYEYPTAFPQFQWTGDVTSYRISVFLKRAEQTSLEDAVSASDPYLVVDINRRESGNLSFFSYPQAAVSMPGVTIEKGPRPLEAGKVYVVEFDGLVKTFGYDIPPIRTLRSFRIADPQGQFILNLLQTALGGGTHQDVLGLIRDGNLAPDAARMTLNGVSISAQELQVILNQNKTKITSVSFED